MVDSEYQIGLSKLRPEQPLEEQRIRALVGATAQIMHHFFDRGLYGTIDSRDGNTSPACWPYVRYLIADGLRERFGYGKPLFTETIWTDQFLIDISDEAKELTKILPEDLTHNEWLFMVKVATHMLMSNPYLVDQGFVSEGGRGRLITQSMLAGTVDGDMYELQFSAWKEKFAQN